MRNKTIFLAILLSQLFLGTVVFAQNQITPSITINTQSVSPCGSSTDSSNCYQLLEQLPTGDPNKPFANVDITTTEKDKGIGGFINFIVEIGIGVAGVLGVVMLTIYGFQYAAEDKNVATFETLKTRITSVILGLLLLLGTFIILKTINPDLLIVSPSIPDIVLNPASLSGDSGPKTGTGSTISIPGAVQGANGRTDVLSIKNNLNKWDTLLSKYAQLYGVDCTLLKAVMTQESKGVPTAQSNAGAIGLMQVMPSNFNGQNVSSSQWFDPETNIKAGATVFASYLKGDPCQPGNGWSRFPGCSNQDIKYVIAGYNGGYKANGIPSACGNTLTKWQCGQGDYAETNNYVSKVIGYYNDLKSANMMCQ